MNDESNRELVLQNQEQTATARLNYSFDLRRRDFCKLLGGGLVVFLSAGELLSQESGRRFNSEDELPQAISAWLHIAVDGKVTVYTGKVEMGQNIRTSLSQQVAEELRVPLAAIQLIMGDTALTPYDMGTFGSRTTPTMGPQLRRVSAAARENLIELAAQRWKVERSSLVAEDGKIADPRSKQSVSYGELTKGQELVKLIADAPVLESPAEWKIVGTPTPKVDGRAFVTGRHKYTSDMVRAGMLHGKVLRPPAFKAGLKSLDSAEAQKIPGAMVVRDGNFVGVAAPDLASATKALQSLRAEWNTSRQTSEATLFEDLRKAVTGASEAPGGEPTYQRGSIEDGFSAADQTLNRTYTIAYIAHVPLEPRAAVAEWKDGKLTVWTGTQRPFGVREELADAFRIGLDDVRVLVPDTGSAYGGKHTGDAALEAARLAKAAEKPVKVVWTREEEFTWAYFRPAGVIDVKSGVRHDGTITTWQYDNYNSGPAAIRTPYNIAHQKITFHPVEAPLRQGSYRGLAAPANHFAREVHMDELAHLVGMDPLEFRLKNATDPRLRAVLQAAAQRFGWGREKSTAPRGFGIAGGTEKGSYVAACVEVEIGSNGNVRVARVAESFECGAIVDPSGLHNQITGAIMMGIGGALFEAIHFDDGRILNPRLADYRVPRFSDMPQIDVEMLDRKDLAPAGAGETPIMALAPAISNAIFAATGTRLRSLPMAPNGLPGKR
ncbi:MAG: molybdopterin cofactor-binding domain-containing protein [Terriglobales bacterium]